MPTSRSCGTTPADEALADRVRERLNGRRLGRQVKGAHVACARAITDTVKQRNLPKRAAVIAVTTAITESALHNYTEAVDHDSLGLFQQRPSQGWGTLEQLTDPAHATGKFLDAMLRKYPHHRWENGEIGTICQKVQVSAVPDAYAHEVHDAQILVDALWAGRDHGSPRPDPAPGVPAFPLSAGRFFGPGGVMEHAGLATWQQRMLERGWKSLGRADGEYGPKTAAVAKAFQQEKGLAVDGLIGPKTWAAAWSAPVS